MSDTPPDPRNDSEEVVHYDDAVIGRVFRWSLVALVVMVVGGGAVFYFLNRKKPASAPKQTKLTAPVSAERTGASLPDARFTDITSAAGITFVHNNGAYGEKLLPETMGSGVAFFDFDGDGDQDLLFVNSTYWPGHVPASGKPTTSALYANDGKGHFTEVTAGSGLDVPLYGMGVAIGDFDNDGHPDVFITGVGENRLFHNEGAGKFRDITAASGLAGATNGWSTSAAWLDYDHDGLLDLFVCNYVRWSREIDFEVGYTLVGVGRAYGQPMNFGGSFPSLYHNDGGGRFTDVSERAGVQIKNPVTGVPASKALGVAPVDVNNDGWIDLVVANDTVQNFVFTNAQNGTFKEVGAFSGVAFDSFGNARGAMGIDAARYRNDDALGIAIGNFANEMTALYVSRSARGLFTDEAITEGIGPASRLLLKFGIFFFDYDLDGRLDVLTANGHLEEEINKVQKSQTYRQPAQLFWNAGNARGGAFVSVPKEKAGTDLFKPIAGRGSAYADIDGDGDLDVVLTQTGGAPLLLRNDQTLKHHWLRVKVVGQKNNRDAIGAWVRARSAGQAFVRQVMPTKSYLSQSELPVTLGFGLSDRVESLEIIWPGGKVQRLEASVLDQTIEAREGAQ